MDVVFVIDSSGSIMDNQLPGQNNWNLTTTFISDVIEAAMDIGYALDHAALVEFSSTARVIFDFNSYINDPKGMQYAVLNLGYMGSETNTPAALNLAYQLFQNTSRGVRTNTAHIMILITDGIVSNAWVKNYLPIIKQIKAAGIATYGESSLLQPVDFTLKIIVAIKASSIYLYYSIDMFITFLSVDIYLLFL